jgi:hypothetical protein
MLRFNVSVQGQAPDSPLAVAFDAAAAAMTGLPRLYFEPDGSFVWTGQHGSEPWQVDGNLIDRGDVLAYVELKGHCPEEQFNELLQALGWPQSPLAFQLPRRGVTLGEAEFRKLAATDAGAV